MEAVVAESAFKQGYSEADFYEVIASDPIKRCLLRGVTSVYEIFGQNFAGDYLHILYRSERDPVVVFHMARMTLNQKNYYREASKMTAKRKRVRIKPLRPGATAQEIVRFFRQHDPQALEEAGLVAVAEDREDLEKLLQRYLFEPNQAQLNIRLPRSVKAMLSRIARRKTVDTSTLARIWIIERLRAEGPQSAAAGACKGLIVDRHRGSGRPLTPVGYTAG